MRGICLLLFTLFLGVEGFVQQAVGQANSKDSVAVDRLSPKVTGYVGAYFELANTGGDVAPSFGIEGNLLFLQHYHIGVYAANQNSNYRKTVIFPNEFQLKYGHAGLVAGYRTHRLKLLDYTGMVRLGFGEMFWENVETFENIYESNFTVINPMVGTEVNLGRFLKVNLGLGYRFFTGIDLPELSNSDLNSFTFTGTLKAGWFGNRKKR